MNSFITSQSSSLLMMNRAVVQHLLLLFLLLLLLLVQAQPTPRGRTSDPGPCTQLEGLISENLVCTDRWSTSLCSSYNYRQPCTDRNGFCSVAKGCQRCGIPGSNSILHTEFFSNKCERLGDAPLNTRKYTSFLLERRSPDQFYAMKFLPKTESISRTSAPPPLNDPFKNDGNLWIQINNGYLAPFVVDVFSGIQLAFLQDSSLARQAPRWRTQVERYGVGMVLLDVSKLLKPAFLPDPFQTTSGADFVIEGKILEITESVRWTKDTELVSNVNFRWQSEGEVFRNPLISPGSDAAVSHRSDPTVVSMANVRATRLWELAEARTETSDGVVIDGDPHDILDRYVSARSFVRTVGRTKAVTSVRLHVDWNVFATGVGAGGTEDFLKAYYQQQEDFGGTLIPIPLFSSRAEQKRTLSQLPSPSSLIYPLKMEVLPSILRVVWFSDGSVVTFPEEQSDMRSVASIEGYCFDTQKWNCSITSFKRAKDGKIVSVVYRKGERSLRYLGENTDGQFGREIGKFFRGVEKQSLREPIVKASVGERHLMILLENGTVLVQGSGSYVDCGTSELNGLVFEAIEGLPFVMDIAAGNDFSALVVRSTTSNSSYGVVCGGNGFLTSGTTTNFTAVHIPGSSWNSEAEEKVVAVVCGVYHVCFQSLSIHEDFKEAEGMIVRCIGVLETLRTDTSLYSTNPTRNVVFGKPPSASLIVPSRTPYTVRGVNDISSGRHHIVITLHQRNVIDPTYGRHNGWEDFPDFPLVVTCGSHLRGQLGTNSRAGSTSEGNVYPIFPFSERVLSSRPPNIYVHENRERQPLQASDHFQLLSVQTAQAAFDSTLVFTSLKMFNSPAYFLSNVTRATHHLPPSGVYTLPQIAADLISDQERPVFSSFENTTQEIVKRMLEKGGQWEWNVSFSVLKGAAAFLVSNQSDSFSTPSGDPLGEAADGVLLHEGPSGSFFKSWEVFRRQQVIESTTGSNISETLLIFSKNLIVFQLSRGRVVELGQTTKTTINVTDVDGQISSRTVYCDPLTRTIVWGDLADIPLLTNFTPEVPECSNGYALTTPMDTWVAMYLLPTVVREVSSHAASSPIVQDILTWSRSLTNESTDASVHLDQFVQSINPPLTCARVLLITDCSSAVYVELFPPEQESASLHFAVPYGSMEVFYLTQHNQKESIQRGKVPPLKNFTEGIGMLSLSASLMSVITSSSELSARNIDHACVFLCLGHVYYFVEFRRDGKIIICSAGVLQTLSSSMSASLSFSITNGSLPRANKSTGFKNEDQQGSNNTENLRPFPHTAEWEVVRPDVVEVRGLDKFNQVDGVDVGYLHFKLSPLGGTLIVNTSSDKDSGDAAVAEVEKHEVSFLLWSNRTVHPIFAKDGDEFISFESSLHPYRASGTRATLHFPIVPPVQRADVLDFTVSRTITMDDDDEVNAKTTNRRGDDGDALLLRFISADPNHDYQLVLLHDRVTFERYRKEVLWSLFEEPIEHWILPNDTFSCGQWPVFSSISNERWISVSLIFNISSPTNDIIILLNGEVACSGNITQLLHDNISLLHNLSAIDIGIRNFERPSRSIFHLREIVFCDSYASIFPCRIGGKEKAGFRQTVSSSPSLVESFSMSITSSMSETASASSTSSESVSVSFTSSESAVPSLSLTESVSGTSPLSSSVSNSASSSASCSVSTSLSQQRNLGFSVFEFDPMQFTAHNIRRNGGVVTLQLSNDSWNFYLNWGIAAQYFSLESRVSTKENRNNLPSVFYHESFFTARIHEDNATLLIVKFGPSRSYNSYRDEVFTIFPRAIAAASHLPIPGSLELTVIGRGFLLEKDMDHMQSFAALSVLGGVVLGGPTSMVSQAAMNGILMNFRCFNAEGGPWPRALHPSKLAINGSLSIGVMVFNSIFMIAMFSVHLLISRLLKLKWRLPIRKAEGVVFFPSWSLCVALLFVPGVLLGSWHWSIEEGTTSAIFAAVIISLFVVVIPLLILMNRLYDDDLFKAKFTRWPEEKQQDIRAKYPLVNLVWVPGEWISTDTHFAFAKRYAYLLADFTEKRRYWFCVQAFEIVIAALVASISTSQEQTCVVQLVCLLAARGTMAILIVAVRPFQRNFGLLSNMAVITAHLVIIMIFLGSTLKGGTRASETFIRGVFTLSTIGIALISLVTISLILWYKLHERLHRKMIARTSQPVPRAERESEDPLLVAPAEEVVVFEDGSVRWKADVEREAAELLQKQELARAANKTEEDEEDEELSSFATSSRAVTNMSFTSLRDSFARPPQRAGTNSGGFSCGTAGERNGKLQKRGTTDSSLLYRLKALELIGEDTPPEHFHPSLLLQETDMNDEIKVSPTAESGEGGATGGGITQAEDHNHHRNKTSEPRHHHSRGSSFDML